MYRVASVRLLRLCQSGVCSLSEFDLTHPEGVCPVLGRNEKCFGTCNPSTRKCEYGPFNFANGVTFCVPGGFACCGGQQCESPAGCGAVCIQKFCYYPGTNVK